ncbi:MAG: nucleotidyltransferase domain-containing protein [Candidatus Woesearchaeota archaeon]
MLQKSSINKTVEIFFRNPIKKHYLMDISRNIGLAHTSVKKNLDKLIKLGLIVKSIENKGNRKFPLFKANFNNKLFKKYKTIYNISSILESKIIGFIEEKLMPKSIVLFGSYLRGEDTEKSDIDLFIECNRDELNIDSFEKKLGRKIELHFNDNFNSYSKELKNNIINGMVLSGFLEGYK